MRTACAPRVSSTNMFAVSLIDASASRHMRSLEDGHALSFPSLAQPMCSATTVSRLGLRASITSQRWYASHLKRGSGVVVAMAKKEAKPKDKEDSESLRGPVCH